MPEELDVGCISYRGMERSAIVLYDLAAYFLPLYGLSYGDFFTYYPVLGFVSALISQAEADLEVDLASYPHWQRAWAGKKQRILSLLVEQQLHDPHIDTHLQEVEGYFALIHKLLGLGLVAHDDVMRAAELRLADFRVLHTILARMRKAPYPERLFDVLQPLGVWAELRGYIAEYADDVAANRYNTYRLLVRLYGKQAPRHMQAEMTRYWELYDQRLAQCPEAEQTMLQEMVARYQQDYPLAPIPAPILE